MRRFVFVCHVLFALDIFIFVEDLINKCKNTCARLKPHEKPGLNMDSFLLLPLFVVDAIYDFIFRALIPTDEMCFYNAIRCICLFFHQNKFWAD